MIEPVFDRLVSAKSRVPIRTPAQVLPAESFEGTLNSIPLNRRCSLNVESQNNWHIISFFLVVNSIPTAIFGISVRLDGE